MWTIIMQIIAAGAIMILTIMKVVHNLLINGLQSDKYYKYLVSAAIGVSTCISCFSSLLIGIKCTAMVETLKMTKLPPDKFSLMTTDFIGSLNLQSIYLLMSIALYGILVYTLKSISKDIEAQIKTPKYTWGDFIEKSANK